MPKRVKFISNNQITGQTAINLTERIVLEMGYTWVPTSGATDAGIDGIIEIRDLATGEARNFILQVQSNPPPWNSSLKLNGRSSIALRSKNP